MPPRQWWFETAAIEEAVARIEFVVDRGWPGIDVVGPRGVGKSIAVAVAVDGLRRGGWPVAFVDAATVPPESLAARVPEALGMTGRLATDWQRLHDLGSSLESTGTRAVAVFDHVESDDAMREVGRLRQGYGSVLTVVAAGRDLSGVDLRVELERLDVRESHGFLAGLASAAGGTFEASAVVEIHAASGGLPARLRRLGELSLLASRSRTAVTADVVQGVTRELVLA